MVSVVEFRTTQQRFSFFCLSIHPINDTASVRFTHQEKKHNNEHHGTKKLCKNRKFAKQENSGRSPNHSIVILTERLPTD